jgi:hypothetical protein
MTKREWLFIGTSLLGSYLLGQRQTAQPSDRAPPQLPPTDTPLSSGFVSQSQVDLWNGRHVAPLEREPTLRQDFIAGSAPGRDSPAQVANGSGTSSPVATMEGYWHYDGTTGWQEQEYEPVQRTKLWR